MWEIDIDMKTDQKPALVFKRTDLNRKEQMQMFLEMRDEFSFYFTYQSYVVGMLSM